MAWAGPQSAQQLRLDDFTGHNGVTNSDDFFLFLSSINIHTLDFNTSKGGPTALWSLINLASLGNVKAVEYIKMIAAKPSLNWNVQYQGKTAFTLLAYTAAEYLQKHYQDFIFGMQGYNDGLIGKESYNALLKVLQIHGAKLRLNAIGYINARMTTACFEISTLARLGFTAALEYILKNPGFNINYAFRPATDWLNVLWLIIDTCYRAHSDPIRKLLINIPKLEADIWNQTIEREQNSGETPLHAICNLAIVVPEAWPLLREVASIPGLNWYAQTHGRERKGDTPMSQLLRSVNARKREAIEIRDYIEGRAPLLSAYQPRALANRSASAAAAPEWHGVNNEEPLGPDADSRRSSIQGPAIDWRRQSLQSPAGDSRRPYMQGSAADLRRSSILSSSGSAQI